ncbi:MAG: STAS-like domain-containing protein [Bacteroidales bacterium]|nr:STAS-like domain-containing protein [Bacteroidales bacterium]
MCTISLHEVLQNKNYPDAGDVLYCLFEKYINDPKIILDFTGVNSLPSLFLNVSIGKFIENYGAETLKQKISFVNITKQQAERIRNYVTQLCEQIK